MKRSNNSDEMLDPELSPDSEITDGDTKFMKNGSGDHGFWGPDFYLNLRLVSPLLKSLENGP